MEFRRSVRRLVIYAPPSFSPEEQELEFREDPLLGIRCRINRRRAKRPKASLEGDISSFVERRERCPFCPENIEKMTPILPPDIFPEGRLRMGEAVLFPNLFPFSEIHATATLSSAHFVPIDSFTPRMIADNLMISLEFIRRASRGERLFPLYIWNHLPPSGASIIHPHTQILLDRSPTPYQERLLKESKRYFEERGVSYWEELPREEKRLGERFIWEGDRLWILASFAPQGNREVLIIFKRASNLLELREEDVEEFSHSIKKVLSGYGRMGINSFNLSSFSGPLPEGLPYYRLHMKIIARPVFGPFYRSDTGFLERLHYEADIDMEPEEVARRLR